MTDQHPDNSEATARAILASYVDSVAANLSDRVEGVVLVGSLATGSYVPGPGDIDQITILRDDAADGDLAQAGACVQNAMAAHAGAVNLAPVIYRRRDLDRPWPTEWDLSPQSKPFACIPEELLRMHDHGRVLLGTLRIDQLPLPTMAEMIAYARRWQQWNLACARKYPALDLLGQETISLRLAVQVLLSCAISDYYYATGKTCFNKHAIAQRIACELPGYRFLEPVILAARVRMSGFAAAPDEHLRLDRSCRAVLEWDQSHEVDEFPRA